VLSSQFILRLSANNSNLPYAGAKNDKIPAVLKVTNSPARFTFLWLLRDQCQALWTRYAL
jgi:hypothetical protein